MIRDRDIEQLIHLLAESDRLAAEHVVEPRRVASLLPKSGGGSLPRRMFAALGYAAAAVVAFAIYPDLPPHAPVPREAGDRPGRGFLIAERTRPGSSEEFAVMAVLRAWNEDCACLRWSLHEWEPGRLVAQIPRAGISDAAVSVGEAPVQQTLLLAVARRSDELLGASCPSRDILDCLNESSVDAAPRDEAALASAVQTCLPPGVAVVSRTVPGRP